MPMICNWSGNGQTLTCRPDLPLAPATPYTIHMGGGMMDADGGPIGMERYGMGMGGNGPLAG